MASVLASTLFTEPRPGLDGDGPLVILGIVLLAGGLVLSARRRSGSRARASAGSPRSGSRACCSPRSSPRARATRGVYFVMAIGGIRLDRDAAILVCGGTVVGLVAIQIAEGTNPAVIAGILFSSCRGSWSCG